MREGGRYIVKARLVYLAYSLMVVAAVVAAAVGARSWG